MLMLAHATYIYGLRGLEDRMSLCYFLGLATLNCMGGCIYMHQWPERLFHGRLDIFGNSHQMMHILVVFGAVCYQRGLMNLLSRLEDGGSIGSST
jgi:adiponectin receptor